MKNRINESSAPEFMRSHPLTINRIAESSERVKLYPVVEDRDESHFKLMQAKAMAGYAENPSLIRDMYRSKIKLGDNSIATRYGYALALSENNEFDLARQEFKPLLHEYPENVTIALSNANNELEDKNIDKGLDLLEILFTQERAKGNHLIDIYYANALVLTDRNEGSDPNCSLSHRQRKKRALLAYLAVASVLRNRRPHAFLTNRALNITTYKATMNLRCVK